MTRSRGEATHERANPMRVKGHTLEGEGAAFKSTDGNQTVRSVRAGGSGGTGFGLCSCGARSDVLRSSVLRRAWHRAHKIEMQDADGDNEQHPLDRYQRDVEFDLDELGKRYGFYHLEWRLDAARDLANRLRLWNRRKRSNLIKKFLAGEDSLRGTVTTTVRKAGDGLQFASPLTIHVHGRNYDYGTFEIPVTDVVHGPLLPEDEGTGLHLESAFSHYTVAFGFEFGCPFGARDDWSKEHLEYGQICLPISIERY